MYDIIPWYKSEVLVKEVLNYLLGRPYTTPTFDNDFSFDLKLEEMRGAVIKYRQLNRTFNVVVCVYLGYRINHFPLYPPKLAPYIGSIILPPNAVDLYRTTLPNSGVLGLCLNSLTDEDVEYLNTVNDHQHRSIERLRIRQLCRNLDEILRSSTELTDSNSPTSEESSIPSPSPRNIDLTGLGQLHMLSLDNVYDILSIESCWGLYLKNTYLKNVHLVNLQRLFNLEFIGKMEYQADNIKNLKRYLCNLSVLRIGSCLSDNQGVRYRDTPVRRLDLRPAVNLKVLEVHMNIETVILPEECDLRILTLTCCRRFVIGGGAAHVRLVSCDTAKVLKPLNKSMVTLEVRGTASECSLDLSKAKLLKVMKGAMSVLTELVLPPNILKLSMDTLTAMDFLDISLCRNLSRLVINGQIQLLRFPSSGHIGTIITPRVIYCDVADGGGNGTERESSDRYSDEVGNSSDIETVTDASIGKSANRDMGGVEHGMEAIRGRNADDEKRQLSTTHRLYIDKLLIGHMSSGTLKVLSQFMIKVLAIDLGYFPNLMNPGCDLNFKDMAVLRHLHLMVMYKVVPALSVRIPSRISKVKLKMHRYRTEFGFFELTNDENNDHSTLMLDLYGVGKMAIGFERNSPSHEVLEVVLDHPSDLSVVQIDECPLYITYASSGSDILEGTDSYIRSTESPDVLPSSDEIDRGTEIETHRWIQG